MAYIPGMPSDIYNKHYKDKEKEKDSSSSSSHNALPSYTIADADRDFRRSLDTTQHTIPGMPTNIPVSVQNQAQQSYYSQQNQQSNTSSQTSSINSKGHNGMPSNVETIYRQQQANYDYINSLLGDDADKILKNTNTIQVYNNIKSGTSTFNKVQEFSASRVYDVLPTSDRNKIVELMQNSKKIPVNNRIAKEVYKLIQTNEAEYQQRTLKEMYDNRYWDNDKPQYVTFATAIDYHNMERRGFETVYIEDGNGALDNKGGVYTIGRDKLAGVPDTINVVLVDHDGNWRYISNSSKRANYVEDIHNRQAALTAIYEDKLNKAFTTQNFIQTKLERLEKQAAYYDKVVNKTRKQEDFDKLQSIIEQIYEYNQYNNASKTKLSNIVSEWSSRYSILDDAARRYSKWTVEDEERFQNIERALKAVGYSNNVSINSTKFSNIQDSKIAELYAANATKSAQKDKSENTAALIAEYNALKKRRDVEGDLPVFMNKDAINHIKETEKNMKTAVDKYNKWNDTLVHTEKGEDFGTYAKRLIFRDLLNPFSSEERAANEQKMSEQVNWGLTFGGYNLDYFKEDLKGMWDSTFGKFNKALAAFGSDFKQASQAYNAANKAIQSGQLPAEAIAELKLKQIQYAEAQDNAYKQLGTTLLNNVVANLSVFDIASVQSTFVAWRMAKHPERYANDPKFKKMQSAYKAILGEDFRGAIDAGDMMQAMLDVKLGKQGVSSDYIYLDGSDLRHASGEKYGLWSSLGVGLGTDISGILGLAKTAVKTITTKAGTKILAKAASESVVEALVRSEVSERVAKEFVSSNTFQKLLRNDIRKSMHKYITDGGKDLEKSMRAVLKDNADSFKHLFLDDNNFKLGIDTFIADTKDAKRYAQFLADAEDAMARTANFAERSLLISKGTVITNTLGTADEILDDVQRKLFKITCPVAGAVTAISKGSKWIKSLKNLGDATDDLLKSNLAVTSSQLSAHIAKLNFESSLDSVGFKKLQQDILDEFSYEAMGDIKRRIKKGEVIENTVKRFSDYETNFMHDVANSYVECVIGKLRNTLKEGNLEGLEALAKQHNFEDFSHMYPTIKANLTDICKYSTDAKGIIKAFDNVYDTAVTKQKIQYISKNIEKAKDHLYGLENAYSIGKKDFSVISVSNAKLYPYFVQSTAKQLGDNIQDFLYTVNADMALFTDAAGTLKTIHESGTAAIEALDNLVYGDLTSGNINKARAAMGEYMNEVKNIYIKNLDDWEANVLQDAFGVQHYLDEINKIVPNHAGNRETLTTIHDNIIAYFEKRGIKVTEDDVSKVLRENYKDFEKLSMTERQSVIYRIAENKGTNAVAQIHDANLKVITDALVDCNSQLNKNISLLQTSMAEASYKRVSDAIANASAIYNTRMLSDAMKEGGVDSTMYMAVMDVMSGNSYAINRIIQTNPTDIAAVKIRDFVMSEARKQLALHNGTYRTFRELAADTVDVSANVHNIEANLDEFIPADDQYIDICVSMVRSTDTAAPKDIAFHMRGVSEKPKVFRKNTAFTVFDDSFASRTYGKTASQLTEEYAALGITGGLTNTEWQRAIQSTIDQYKQMALEQNKTLRFIGFNSSDAITGNNKYLSDVLRSCGVNANMSNSLDLADAMRTAAGEYVFDSGQIDALYRGLMSAIENAHSQSISLNILPTLAYDSKYNCAEMLKGVLERHSFSNDLFNEQAKYIIEELKTTVKGLGTGEYNKTGQAMGAYLDATAFAQIIEDAGQSSIHSNGDLMKIITECAVNGETQLGMHKIIETAMDSEWVDYSRINEVWSNNFTVQENIHAAVLQINNIYSNLHRLDLITDADLDGLKYIYTEIAKELPASYSTTNIITRIFKVDELSAQQLYAVDKWLLDKASGVMDAAKYDAMYSKMLFNASRPASYLSEVGYRFVRNNIIDYTDDSLDAFLVKFLDTSEEGYRYAQALNELAALNKKSVNLKNYTDAVEGIFQKNNIHGVQDRVLALQMAEVHRPIIEFQDDIKKAYENAYGAAYYELKEAAPYDLEMVHRLSVERGVKAAKEEVMRTGDKIRAQAVEAVAELNEDALKTHLIRNCCGGLVIDPSSKAVQGIDLPLLLERWKKYGLEVETFKFTEGNVRDRNLIRVYIPNLVDADMDAVFANYNHSRVAFSLKNEYDFDTMIANRFNPGEFRHASFGASDMTLISADHLDNMRRFFFSDTAKGGTLLDLNKNFSSWADELYSCNMWTDMDLKQLVNPYYTDNILNNIAQNTHQLRNNISAVHDLGTIVNNRYLNTEYILQMSGVLNKNIPMWEQRKKIVQQITDQKQHLCRLTVDSSNHIKVIDYTPRLQKLQKANKDTNKYFETILKNTVMLDDSMVDQLSDWAKSTTVALRYQASNVPEWLSNAYNIYKKTIRSGTITMYLYGNRGTGLRNMTDSSTKGLNEILQYNQNVESYFRYYKDAIADSIEYADTYQRITEDLGTVNHETIVKFFNGDTAAMNKFNIFYGYERTLGGDTLTDLTLKETREDCIKYLMTDATYDRSVADEVRKLFDSVYSRPKYYGLTKAQLETHKVKIYDECVSVLKDAIAKNKISVDEDQFKQLCDKFWDYHPTVATWGDTMTQFPILNLNKTRFNNAETRARLAVYRTFLDGGASEYEAMQHVTATQFHYAGLGKVEDFMPFTQYKLYNALYWFNHANMHAVSTAWRAAQYNDDGYMTNQEIAAMITKYNQSKYYIFDKGIDESYDEYFENNLNVAGHILLDGVDSYLGVPRTFNAGNLDLNGTHYLKLGNSFVEEIDMIVSCAAGAYAFATTLGSHIKDGDTAAEKIRLAYESFKYTPLYDSFYSPWKSYIDLIAFSYDHKKETKYEAIKSGKAATLVFEGKAKTIEEAAEMIANSSAGIWSNYEAFMANRGTHSEAIAALPLVGAILSNMVGRWKSFDLNLGELAALITDPDAKTEMYSYLKDMLCDTAGMFVPSVVGTKVEPDTTYNTYGAKLTKNYLVENPTTYFDIIARLQNEMGFDPDEAQQIYDSMKTGWELGDYRSKLDYYYIAKELYDRGLTDTEIINLFAQQKLPKLDNKRFLAMTSSLPNYLAYDKHLRNQIISYYKALGYTTDGAWAKLMSHPAVFKDGKLTELTLSQSRYLSEQHNKTYWALHSTNLTDDEWDAYWNTLRELGFYYPKGKWKETRDYLVHAGYTYEEARAMLLHGYMLDDDGRLVDVQGQARRRAFSYNTLKGAEWDAYWNTIPDYTKYEKGAYGRTMKALKKMGYNDEQARALIQQGIYVDKSGNMMNVTGMQRPVLGYPSFTAYYQTIPDYCKYEKGAFKRTYAALKQLGYDYETSLMLIQQGAYLMDISAAPSLFMDAVNKQQIPVKRFVMVKGISAFVQQHSSTVIKGADGKNYMFVDCSGLQRPRKSFSYSRGSGRRSHAMDYMYRPSGRHGDRKGKTWNNYRRSRNSYSSYYMRSPFVTQNNVSSYNGFTRFRGKLPRGKLPGSLTKPYVTKGYVSTYSLQNFLNGASYGMRKVYKIDMRQYKSGALSTKSAYPASYRNIVVAYRRNMYKDLYAKYGASRMQMRANQVGYSNASIVRLRRNEIYNRERYAERRDKKAKEKVRTRAAR